MRRARRTPSVNDAVAALLLRLVQAGVGALAHRARVVVVTEQRDAERRRHAERALLRLDAQALDGEAHALGEAHGAHGIGALEDETEFFAAVARNDVARARG